MKNKVTKQTAYNIIWADAAIRQHYDKNNLRYALPKKMAALINAPEIKDMLNLFKEDYQGSVKYRTTRQYNGIEANIPKMKLWV